MDMKVKRQTPDGGVSSSQWMELLSVFTEAGFTPDHIRFLTTYPHESVAMRKRLDERLTEFEKQCHSNVVIGQLNKLLLHPWVTIPLRTRSQTELLTELSEKGIEVAQTAHRLLYASPFSLFEKQDVSFALLSPRELAPDMRRPTSARLLNEEYLAEWSAQTLSGQRVSLCDPYHALHLLTALSTDRFLREKVVRVGMKPIRADFHDEIFQIQRIESGLSLQSTFAGTSNRLSPDARILLQLHTDTP